MSRALALVSMVSCLTMLSAGLRASELFFGGVEFFAADVGGGVDDLALKVAGVDDVEVDQAECADAGGGEVESERGAESAGADAEDFGGLEPLLAFHADLGEDEVAGVAGKVVGGELGELGGGGDFEGHEGSGNKIIQWMND